MKCTGIKLREKRGCVQKQGAEIAYEHVKACRQHACNRSYLHLPSHKTYYLTHIYILLEVSYEKENIYTFFFYIDQQKQKNEDAFIFNDISSDNSCE
jgi:hypothetical protein